VSSEVGVKRMSVVSVNLYLFKKREICIELLGCEVKYLKRLSRLLLLELIAGHCQNLKTLILPLFIGFHHF